jgi:hypothetical protein
MRIYEIVFESEGTADGFQRLYYTSKRAMRAGAREIKREHAEETEAAQKRLDSGEQYPAFPTYRVDRLRLNTLHFKGTCRETVLQALRYNTD